MDYKRKPEKIRLLPKGTTDAPTKAQLPEWHPFAVWQTQIRNDQTSPTETQPVLQSAAS